jgi:hypothetical protein
MIESCAFRCIERLVPWRALVGIGLRYEPLGFSHSDVRNIISDDESLQEGVLPALQEYNLAQFMTVDVPGTSHQVHFAMIRPLLRHLMLGLFSRL